LPLVQVRLVGQTDPLVAALLDEQRAVGVLVRESFCPVKRNGRAELVVAECPKGNMDALDHTPLRLSPELKQMPGLSANWRTEIVMAPLGTRELKISGRIQLYWKK